MEPSSQFLVFGAPQIEEAEIDEVIACLRSGWLGTGPRVARFEADFAEHCGVGPAQVAAVNSCTAALHVSMLAADIEPGAEVITTPLTFCATVNAILHAGLQPVLADVDPQTQNIDPAAIEAAITPRTRAILPVHFAGRPCDMDAIMAIARKHDLVVIEDCAHAVEATYHGQPVGTFGEFGCFSFYVTKNVVAGEGGMIVGRNEEQIARTRILALHGMSKDAWHRFSDSGYRHYQVMECGFKYNMMDIQAALGLHQLARVDRNWQRRAAIWHCYDEAFAGLPITLPAMPEANTRHGRHLYTVMVDSSRCGISRDFVLEAMTTVGVGTGVHYMSIPEHSYYQQRFGWTPERWPRAMKLGRETVSLPLSAGMSDKDVERVIDAVREVIPSE
ncbi:DegT/DnrJ/EryC1/StrS family aminotransferase [Dyella nitratireducens]|uniref:Spore coat polysaccharide biosynthesis protein SpsC n=1 Tax=Dyella nitratireducens TaxID=1849580 RepID=A0ABQ1FPN6_9GAMM|nr:DegT/DnrJ/EryC1/StrS aminotransferase family protein [Dyella nitratireducens]GGA25448.1 spore coat polysaccharide biosynthesis protein SpsC [Dyella nitratireducens]GLQ43686.1 spore coat polysaccharide biosynthesis protein SpsC [Dyella nitratireducens]